MKGTDQFKKVIQNYLNELGSKDPLFSETLKKENKDIDNCITYILNTVKNSGNNGFADEEIFNMAVHYYDEDNIEIGKPIDVQVVVNHSVELTEDDKLKAKQQAIDSIIQEQKDKIKAKKSGKKQEQRPLVATLFD